MLVCTFGDALLDVVVVLERDLVGGADVPARTTVGAGGQAANVAAWVVELGGRARFVGRMASDPAGQLTTAALDRRGVELAGAVATARGGVVVSLVQPGGDRTMASDRGDAAALSADELEPGWLDCDHLHVSGYAFAVEPMRAAAVRAVSLARERGARVSLDVAASTLVESIGAGVFRELVDELAPDVVFCNEAEDAALGGRLANTVWIVKSGAGGATVDGVRHASSAAVRVVDTTGAGDAFAAGWIVGGISLALDAAARCIAQPGAMP
jgi:ribokinase